MKNWIIILFLSIATLASAQNIKKGYKHLEKQEYDKAQDSFKKDLSDDRENVGANFGMALVLADDNSPYFNIIDAWEYVERIGDRTGDLSQEDIEVIGEYFAETEVRRTSRPVKKKIEIALEAIESRLIKYIREENNLEAVYEVLERYPDFRHYDNVVHIRNQFEYRKYEKQNTRAAYEEFIQKFPESAQVPKAIKSRNKIAFEEVKSQNTLSAYQSYISEFPESDYLQTAIKLRNAAAFNEAKQKNTLEAYENFIANYPDALEISDAKTKQQNLLYEQAKRIKSLQAFNDFIGKYPDGQYFVDIFNLKASELGALYQQQLGLTASNISWVKAFDNNSQLESGGIAATLPDGSSVFACNTRANDSAYADAWLIKLSAEGNMLWNKTIGQPFEDSVSNILVDSNGDIIVVGYTWLSADSLSKKGWMFKVASDGKKLWNKNLGNILISSSAIDQQDRIYIGGGVEKDTLGTYYALTTFNAEAAKIGEKVYTGKGLIQDITISPSGDIFLCGTNWLTCMEAKRYLKWDAMLSPDLTADQSAINPAGDYFVTGANLSKIFYAKYNGTSGKEEWLQAYDKSDSTQVINATSATMDGNLLVLEEKANENKLKLFSAEGSVLGVKELVGELKLESAESNAHGTILLLSNGDLIVVNYSEITTL